MGSLLRFGPHTVFPGHWIDFACGCRRVTNVTEVAVQLVLATAKGRTSTRPPHARPGRPSSASTRCRIGRRPAAPAHLPRRPRPDRVPATPRAVPRPGRRSSRRVTGRRSGAYRRVPRSVSLPSRASSRASDEISSGWRSESSAITAVGRSAQSHDASTFTAAAHHVVGNLGVGFVEHTPQPRTPAQIGQPADGAAGCGSVADLSAQVHAELGQTRTATACAA